MRLLQTKENRLFSRELDRKSELERHPDFKHEIFERIEIQTWTECGKIYLRIYRGTSAKPYYYYRIRNEAELSTQIQKEKEREQQSIEWMNKRKESNKGKRLTGSAMCADAIRAELKLRLPLCKFSVKSSTFSGGDSVHISWEDGYTEDQVRAITDKYQAGHFNGMEDIYEYHEKNTEVTPDGKIIERPTAKYVQTSRNYSNSSNEADKAGTSLYNNVGRELCRLQGVEFSDLNQCGLYGSGDTERLQTRVYRALRISEMHNGFNGVKKK